MLTSARMRTKISLSMKALTASDDAMMQMLQTIHIEAVAQEEE